MRKDQCKFCTSRKCNTRIVTPNLGYDEIACRKHGRELEKHADETLNGGLRCNTSSMGSLKRGDPYPALE